MKKSTSEKDTVVLFSFKERLLVSFLSLFTFTFLIFIFAPVDIFANNISEMKFSLHDFLPLLAVVSLIIVVVFSLYLSTLRSMIFNMVTAAILILPVGGSLQQIVFSSTGEVTGDAAAYNTKEFILVTVFWVVVSATLITLSVQCKKHWKQVVTFIAVLLFFMNGATLVTDYINYDFAKDRGNLYDYTLTTDNIFSLSDDENIVILLVDRLDNLFLDTIFENEPEFSANLEQSLDGFTYYTNNTSLYGRTFPSVPYMITANEYTGEVSAEDYLDTTYKNSAFITDLKNNGYRFNIYTKHFYTYTDGSALLGVADNVAKVIGYSADKSVICEYLMIFSLSRYVPRYLLNVVDLITGDQLSSRTVTIHFDGHEMFYADDAKLYKELCEKKLSVDESMGKNYTFLHLEGPHTPYTLNADCTRSNTKTDSVSQTMGSLTLVMEYIKQMKEIGVYDNSTIIIAADHGFPDFDREETIYTKVTSALMIKPRGSAGTKLQYSSAQVSHTNLAATIIQDAGIETTNDYGKSVFEIGEGETTKRRYEKFFYIDSHLLGISEYEINGDANNFENWRYIKSTKTDWEWY